jgi:hypothetical protein
MERGGKYFKIKQLHPFSLRRRGWGMRFTTQLEKGLG